MQQLITQIQFSGTNAYTALASVVYEEAEKQLRRHTKLQNVSIQENCAKSTATLKLTFESNNLSESEQVMDEFVEQVLAVIDSRNETLDFKRLDTQNWTLS